MIPHRIRDGYGLNDSLIEDAGRDGIDTVLTCDNGIAAASSIALAIPSTNGEQAYVLLYTSE